MSLLIKNALIVNAEQISARPQDILLEEGAIKRIASSLNGRHQQVIDAAGKFVLPGLIDLHVHLREPGR